ncbi:MAG TPA: cobaltochelatase subunit CobN, partial [Alphaproteobacteria bacterium]
MHLLTAQPGTIADGPTAVDLGQSPGDIVYLTAADSEISLLATAQRALTESDPSPPRLRLANLMRLGHNYSVDLYVERVVAQAKLVIVRLLGGRAYWPYGVAEVSATCRARHIPVAFLPGDDQPDADLTGQSTLPAEAVHRLWRFQAEGGPQNAANFLRYAASLIGRAGDWREPVPLLRAGLYWPGAAAPDLDTLRARWPDPNRPVAAILFYRALLQAGNLTSVDGLITALDAAGLNPLPIFAASLRDATAAAMVEDWLAACPPDVVVNGTGFSRAAPGGENHAPPTHRDCPELQVIFAGSTEEAWRAGTRGLSPQDIAMNVALPEVDGRIITR